MSDSALEVINKLTAAGYQAYLVGGCVRDLLLDRQPKDFDVATDALPEDVKSLFSRCQLIGRRFRLAHVRCGGEVVDVATFRAGPGEDSEDEEFDGEQVQLSENGQLVRDNIYGSIEQDARRRDFSVNALFYDPAEQTVIDYVGGVADLERGELVTIGDPLERFREDPVRMLRAVRFSAKLELAIRADAQAAIEELASLLHHVPPARMLDEVLKLFHSGCAVTTLEMLREAGLFRYLFPFTEQSLVELSPSIAMLALQNTDERIRVGKPVIPAFLFACLLWEPLQMDITTLVDSGQSPKSANATAVEDVIRDQSQYVSIPRRLSIVVREIWSLQWRLERRAPRSIKELLAHKRFRAAYDFLLLRGQTGEVSQDLCQWWTEVQDSDPEVRQRLIAKLAPQKRSQKGGQKNGQRNGRRRRRRRHAA